LLEPVVRDSVKGCPTAHTTYWLMSYGNDIAAIAALGSMSPRFSRARKPADLLVDQATKFAFIINLKTTKVLGLEVPPASPHAPTR
jgi:hypothetical protein